MFAAIAIVGVSLVLGVALALLNHRPPEPTSQQQQFDDSSIPRANEGDSIPVVFGTREVRRHNVIEVGNYWSDEIEIDA